MLIVTDQPAGERAPHGGGSVILTTFGLDEAAFADLQARWSDWWCARYTAAASGDSQ